MTLLTELEIDRACDEYLRSRGCGLPQPVVGILDAEPDEESFEAEIA